MEPLVGRLRRYAWGSRRVIAELQGRPSPTAEAEAELWLGAHPAEPSTVDGSVPLTDRIAADPVGVLGRHVIEAYGARLPYLMKLLAAEEPLSLQAHPDAVWARARYAAGDPRYVDPHHKPELLVAVDRFEALCGFRSPAESADKLRRLGVLPALVDVLAGPGSPADRLRAGVTMLLDRSPADCTRDVLAVAAVDELAAQLAARYPADPGVLVALLLNHVVLRPGEAIWMPAGNLHSYLRGTGVEIMAASDNVLRGGLTRKPIDIPELLRVLRFDVLSRPVVRPVPVAPGVVTWPVPVPDFTLHRAVVTGAAVQVAVPGPRIALCLTGEVTVDDGAGQVTLVRGQAAFGPAGHRPLVVSGSGEVYVAATRYVPEISDLP